VQDLTRGIDFNDKTVRRQDSYAVVASVCCNEKSREGGKVRMRLGSGANQEAIANVSRTRCERSVQRKGRTCTGKA
jgi:hypothetical protein